MTNDARLYDALRKAHAAGDTQSAAKLADYIRGTGAQPAPGQIPPSGPYANLQRTEAQPPLDDRIGTLYQERGEDVQAIRDDPRLNPVARGFAEAGEAAEFIGGVVGETVVKPVLKGAKAVARETVGRLPVPGREGTLAEVLPGEIEQVGEGLASSALGQRGMKALQAGGRAWTAFEAEHPNIAAVLAGGAKTGLVAAEAVPIAKGATTVAKAATIPSRTAVKAVKAGAAPFTEAGGKVRAGKRAQELVEDPAAAAEAALRESPLSPAQRTGEEGLMKLERSVAERSPELAKARAEQISGARKELKGQLIPEGDIQKSREFIEGRKKRITDQLSKSKDSAVKSAEARIASLAPEQRTSQASIVMRDELDKAHSSAKAIERDLWDQVPGAGVGTTASRAKYAELKKGMSKANEGDMPEVAKRLLDPTSKEKLGSIESLKELQGLRSKLLEEGREASAAGQAFKAKMANNLADSILEDIGAQANKTKGPVGEAMRMALDYSRETKQTYGTGAVGRILKKGRSGDDKIAPELTLDAVLGAGKVKGDVAIKDMLKAADTPESKQAINDYMLSKLNDAAVKGGKLNVNSAESFINKNSDILDRFPDTKSNLVSAVKAQRDMDRVSTRQAKVDKALSSTQRSATARLLKSKVGKEIDTVIGSKNPQMAARDLMKLVKSDKDAVQGVRSGAMDYLFRKSSTGKVDDFGNDIVSGNSMAKTIKENRKALSEIMGVEGLRRVDAIASEFQKLEKAVSSRGLEKIIDDTPNQIIDTIVRIKGAQVGSAYSRATGGGGSVQAPGIMSGKARAFLKTLTGDKAERLLIEAIHDPDLFSALLKDNIRTPAGAAKANKKLNAWLAGPGAAAFTDFGDDNEQE